MWVELRIRLPFKAEDNPEMPDQRGRGARSRAWGLASRCLCFTLLGIFSLWLFRSPCPLGGAGGRCIPGLSGPQVGRAALENISGGTRLPPLKTLVRNSPDLTPT